jgi:hypothetical protein
VIFVPAAFCADAIFEALDFDISTICCITEGVPVHDMMRVANYLRIKEATLIGPNCPGALRGTSASPRPSASEATRLSGRTLSRSCRSSRRTPRPIAS